MLKISCMSEGSIQELHVSYVSVHQCLKTDTNSFIHNTRKVWACISYRILLPCTKWYLLTFQRYNFYQIELYAALVQIYDAKMFTI